MKTEKTGNGKLLADNNLRVVHIRKRDDNPNGRDMTIAFRGYPSRSHGIDIATAVVHPKDTFQRKTGTEQAIQNFLAGKVVHIPHVWWATDPVQQLMTMFRQ